MSSRSSKPLKKVGKKAKSAELRGQQVAEPEPQQVVERKSQGLAPKRPYRPHFLRPSAIRRICRLPVEKSAGNNTEAKVVYLNPNFGKCSLAVCHEDLCPFTETCKRHKGKGKGQPKTSIAMRKLKGRIARRTTRRMSLPKGRNP